MGRRKIEIRPIKDDRNRSVTFLKRKGGLFKKAHELSVLCSVDVAVIIFGHNKKLYEFSSGDITDILRRYQYYGPPHEHKGPSDYKNKGGDDDDDDEDDGDDGSQRREDSLPPQQQNHMMPQHLQPTAFQHVRAPGPSASPPMANGAFRQHTPQPPGFPPSRSNSRNEIRRPTQPMVAISHPQPTPPPQNGFAYVPNPPIYNPQAAMQAAVPPPQPSPQPQFQQFQQQQQQQQPQQQPPPPQPQSHQQIQQAHQQFLQDQRRQSHPPPPPPGSLQPPPQPAPRSSPQPEPQTLRPPSPPQRKHTKSQSIFTPIDEGGSVLARHFFGAPNPPNRDDRTELRPPPRAISQPSQPSQLSRSLPAQPVRAITTTSATPEFAPPTRSNTGGSKSGSISNRPKLNLTIPSEEQDNESGSGSPNRTLGERSANPTDRAHNGIVLPPPSPSASALLSAGTSGPPNPFARPPPPTSQQNTSAYGENRNNNSNSLDTPISALPSRYMEQSLIASPGGLFSDWDSWGRAGLNSAVLPSPLTFPTPADAKPPMLFGRRDSGGGGEDKRKAEEMTGGDAKRMKI